MTKSILLPVTFCSVLALGGCAGMSDTQQRAVTGSLGGAAAGAAIGAMAGNAGLGAGIGAATGLLGGFLYGKHQDSVDQAYQQGRRDASQGH